MVAEKGKSDGEKKLITEIDTFISDWEFKWTRILLENVFNEHFEELVDVDSLINNRTTNSITLSQFMMNLRG